MSNVLNKSAVQFDDFRIHRELQDDGTYKWFVDVGYRVETQEGETYTKDWQVEILGSLQTTISNVFDTVVSRVKTREGL